MPLITSQGSKLDFGNENRRYKASLQLLTSLIMLLNDEQPDIRYYLCESEASHNLIEKSDRYLKTESDRQIPVLLNDQYLIEQIFHEFTSRALEAANTHSEKLILYARTFLINDHILRNPYREHLSQNYEDKIFFFEPLNKFYDLLWIKRLAFNQLMRIHTYILEHQLPTNLIEQIFTIKTPAT